MKKKLYKDVKLKDGTTLQKGVTVTVSPAPTCLLDVVTPEGRNLKLKYTSIFKPPTLKQLEKWDWEGYCMTPAGKKVEPDGIDSEGYPSWMRILGII